MHRQRAAPTFERGRREIVEDRFAVTQRAPVPSHERTFHAEVALNGERLAAGSGPSKKAA
jgi:dsRNA-specific ribonuclease